MQAKADIAFMFFFFFCRWNRCILNTAAFVTNAVYPIFHPKDVKEFNSVIILILNRVLTIILFPKYDPKFLEGLIWHIGIRKQNFVFLQTKTGVGNNMSLEKEKSIFSERKI